MDERLRRHNAGDSPATRHGVPWKIVYREPHASRSEATKRESYLKTGAGRDELKRILAAKAE